MMTSNWRKYALPLAVVSFLLVAGCLSGPAGSTGPPNVTTTTTPTPTIEQTKTPSPIDSLDLPSEVRSKIEHIQSYSPDVQDALLEARESNKWVILNSEQKSDLSDQGLFYANESVWEYSLHTGTRMIDANRVNETTDDSAVEYENLSSQQQRLFRNASANAGPYTIGPDEKYVHLPDTVRYEGKVYNVHSGTHSLGAGLDVDRYQHQEK